MMAVPADLVPAVTAFIEGRSLKRQAPESIEDEGFVHGWDRATVRRAYRESGDNMRDLLRFLASERGREVTSYELAEALGAKYGWNSVAGMLGAFGRRCSNRYGLDQPMWEVRYDAEGRVLLRLPGGAAAAIDEATRDNKT